MPSVPLNRTAIVLFALAAGMPAACDRAPAPTAIGHPPIDSVPAEADTAVRAPLPSAILSNPTFAPSAPSAGATAASSATVAYVSIPPGAVPGGVSALIENRRLNELANATLVDGGFDPVAIGAVAGDTIVIDINVLGRHTPLRYFAVAPARRRPRVVRTQPPPGKRDVPLSAALVVVFSEPLDPVTLLPEAVFLSDGSSAVQATLAFVDEAQLTVSLTPHAALSAARDHELVVTELVRDQDGDQAEGLRVPFVTGDRDPPAALSLGRLAFSAWEPATSTFWVFTMKPDGTDRRRLTPGNDPEWSPDGKRLAFWNYERISTGAWRPSVWVIGADGTGLTRLTPLGYQPTWSPDGQRIAFGCGGICVMNADGTGVSAITYPSLPTIAADICIEDSAPSWSPDGSTIAFMRWPRPWPEHRPERVPCLSLSASMLFPLDFWPGVVLIGPDGTAERPLLGPLGLIRYGGSPTWSPDGTQLAVYTTVGSPSGLRPAVAVGRVDGTGTLDLAAIGTAWSMFGGPAWSPDGTRLVVGSGQQVHFVTPTGSDSYVTSPVPVGQEWTVFWSWSRQ